MELALKARSGTATTRINPKEIIIEEEIRTNHLVVVSNSISKNKLLI
tara:strand:+ start:1191 stop:1331 length:141 start_codon:yes stop_codon:yes gene_type:complete